MRPTCQDGSDTLHIGGVSDVVRKERVCPAILEGERWHLPMSRSGWAQRPPLPARVRSALDNSFERTFTVDGIVARKPRPAQADYLGAAGPGPRARPLRPRHDRPAAPDAIPPSSSAPAWVARPRCRTLACCDHWPCGVFPPALPGLSCPLRRGAVPRKGQPFRHWRLAAQVL